MIALSPAASWLLISTLAALVFGAGLVAYAWCERVRHDPKLREVYRLAQAPSRPPATPPAGTPRDGTAGGRWASSSPAAPGVSPR